MTFVETKPHHCCKEIVITLLEKLLAVVSVATTQAIKELNLATLEINCKLGCRPVRNLINGLYVVINAYAF